MDRTIATGIRTLSFATSVAALALASCVTMPEGCPSGTTKTAIDARYAVYYVPRSPDTMPDMAVLIEDTNAVKSRCLVEVKPEGGADCVPPRSRAKVIDGKTYCVYP